MQLNSNANKIKDITIKDNDQKKLDPDIFYPYEHMDFHPKRY